MDGITFGRTGQPLGETNKHGHTGPTYQAGGSSEVVRELSPLWAHSAADGHYTLRNGRCVNRPEK